MTQSLFSSGAQIPQLEVRKINFGQAVYFTQSIIHGNMIFEEVIFREFDLSNAELQETQFSMVIFTKKAAVEDTKFNNVVNFTSTNFQKSGIFSGAKFNDIVFVNVSFQDEAVFDYANIQKNAHFGIRR
jgi:uncharacterized protein YjbI with pentapeptide repeats